MGEFKCVCDVFCAGFIYVDFITSVVLRRRSQIPYFYPMWFPGFTLPLFLMYYDLSAWVCKGGLVEINIPSNAIYADFLVLILMDARVSMRYGIIWGGGTIGACGTFPPHHIVP